MSIEVISLQRKCQCSRLCSKIIEKSKNTFNEIKAHRNIPKLRGKKTVDNQDNYHLGKKVEVFSVLSVKIDSCNTQT